MAREQQGNMEGCFLPDEAPLPHLAGLTYFRSPPKYSSPFYRESTNGPTPRKMAAVGGLTSSKRHGHGRRCSSIPRPTSKLTRLTTSPPRTAGTHLDGCRAVGKDAPQTVVKPRTYSRTRQGTFVPNQNDPPSICKVPRSQPPRLSLPTTASRQVDGSNDISGIRQQLPLTHYSRYSLASLDALVSSASNVENNTTTSLPLPNRLNKSNTSAPVAKTISPVIPQRQLMGPLGPPVPRSQTMGNLMCFASAVESTPSPSKSSFRTISTATQRSEVGVMDALAESRMTDKEIEYFNQVAKDVEANKQRMKGGNRAMRLPSKKSETGSASSKTLKSFTTSNRSSDQVAQYFSDVLIDDSSRKLPFQGAKLKIMRGSRLLVASPVLTPDSGVSMRSGMRSGSAVSWAMNPKLVHSHEPVQYWRGRFSTISDRLRSEDNGINSPNFEVNPTLADEKPTSFEPKIDNSDTFELDEIYRTRRALDELRSCCCTADASKSFEFFAQEICARLDRESASERRGPFYTHSAESKVRLLAAGIRPRILGLDNNIAAATMKIINAEPKPRSSMTRSKTTGDMGQSTNASLTGTGGKGAKLGWRRPSYLKAQEEVLAGEMAVSSERRARMAAAAQRNARRSGIGLGGITRTEFVTQSTALAPATKPTVRHSLPRKSSGSKAGTATNAETLKRVFSESVRSVRRMGRSFTGLSGSGEA